MGGEKLLIYNDVVVKIQKNPNPWVKAKVAIGRCLSYIRTQEPVYTLICVTNFDYNYNPAITDGFEIIFPRHESTLSLHEYALDIVWMMSEIKIIQEFFMCFKI